jgi:hypothetical protein
VYYLIGFMDEYSRFIVHHELVVGMDGITILWDGSRIHDRSKAVQAWLAKHPDVKTERLPAYAFELNPDELV